jgi:conflict system pore-forming effector with SLATT domain
MRPLTSPRRPALLRRLPRPFWKPPPSQSIVSPAALASYPELADDFAIADRILLTAFRNADAEALRAQNTFHLAELGLSLGAILATLLGAVQTALGGGILVIGLIEAGLTSALGATALGVFAHNQQRDYYRSRLQAESLRGEYFRFVGRLEPYATRDAEQRAKRLQDRVDAILA